MKHFHDNDFILAAGSFFEKITSLLKPKEIKQTDLHFLANEIDFYNPYFKDHQILEILKLLKLQDEEGTTIGMLITRSQPEQKIRNYISFLLRLYRGGLAAAEVIELCKIQDKKGFTFIMDVAQLCTKEVVIDLIELMQLLAEENDIKEKLAELMQLSGKVALSTGRGHWSFVDIVSHCQDVYVLNKLITSGMVPDCEYSKLADKKSALLNFIFAMTNTFFKKNALREALNPFAPLGKVFSLHQELRSVPGYDMRERMQAELTRLNKQDLERWRVGFFPLDKDKVLTEEDLDFKDPYTPTFVMTKTQQQK